MKTSTQILFILIVTCFANKNCFSQNNNKLSFVKIEFTGFNIETLYCIDCDDFEHLFNASKKIKTIKTHKDLLAFISLQKQFSKNYYTKDIDTRGSITFKYGLKEEKYCFDEFGTFYLNGSTYKNKALLALISDIVYGNHPDYLDQ